MSRPYDNDAQIFTFGVHGTLNTRDDVRGVAGDVSVAVGRTTNGANLFDNGFDWRARERVVEFWDEDLGRNRQLRTSEPGTAHQTNTEQDRGIASQRLAAHVLQQVDNAIERGTLDRDKPLTINLVGFSHGGNVAIQASDDIARGLRERGIESAIHLTTLSTPAYNNGGPEDPATARQQVQAQGVNFAHSHFAVQRDGVVDLARGDDVYNNGFTRNTQYPAVSGHDIVANHGATQNPGAENYRDEISETMRRTFNGLAPGRTRAEGESGIEVATADPNRLVSGNDAANRQFAQALQGTNGDRDAAAVALETIRNTPGYKPDQDVAVIQGRNGNYIVSQGQGDTALNAAVPQANPGDFDRVAARMQQQEQTQTVAQNDPSRQVAQNEPNPERTAPVRAV